jgi:hypothetical protein
MPVYGGWDFLPVRDGVSRRSNQKRILQPRSRNGRNLSKYSIELDGKIKGY